MQPPLTRADIVNRADIPRDVLTFWVRGGVLQPIEAPKGTGNRLKFRWYEVNIAAIMNQLRILGVKIEGMLSIGRMYRDAIAYFDGLGVDYDQSWAIWRYLQFEAAASKEVERLDLINRILNTPGFDPEKYKSIAAYADITEEECDAYEAYWREQFEDMCDEKRGAERLTPELLELAHKVDKGEFFLHHESWYTITARPKAEEPVYANTDCLTYFWRVGEGEDYRMARRDGSAAEARKDGAFSMIALDEFALIHRAWNGPSVPIVGDAEAGEGKLA